MIYKSWDIHTYVFELQVRAVYWSLRPTQLVGQVCFEKSSLLIILACFFGMDFLRATLFSLQRSQVVNTKMVGPQSLTPKANLLTFSESLQLHSYRLYKHSAKQGALQRSSTVLGPTLIFFLEFASYGIQQ